MGTNLSFIGDRFLGLFFVFELLTVTGNSASSILASTRARSPIRSPDSNLVAYDTHQGKKAIVVVDGQPGPAYDSVVNGVLTFDDAEVLSYFACKGGFLYRVRSGVK